jgi:phosphate transport system permease protein
MNSSRVETMDDFVNVESEKEEKFIHNSGSDLSSLRLVRRNFFQKLLFMMFRFAAGINGIVLLIIVYYLVANGWKAINWTFLTQAPMSSMTMGGILPCIVGTLFLGIGALVVAFPIGVASAIYINEYARPGKALRIIRLGISNLAGVPSVVFGLFGLAFFVIYLKMGVSLLAGALTLGAMSLPVIIGSSEEALKSCSKYLS